MPSYPVISTRFGSTSSSRTSSGVARVSTDTSSELRQELFPAPVAPAIRMCGILARLATTYPPSMSLPSATTSGWWSLVAARERRTSPSATFSRSVFGISTPTADLPGIGEMIRTSGDLTAYAMLRDNWVIRSTFTPGPSSTSYRVTVGPRANPVTAASTSNCSKTPWSALITSSLARLRAFGASPTASRCGGGSL